MNGLRENGIRDVFTDDLNLSPESFFDGRNAEEVSPPSRSDTEYGADNTPPKQDERSEWGPNGEDDVLRPPGDKPKRPLSAYNFFFQLERERIIQSPPDERDNVVEYTVEDVKRIARLQIEKAKAGKPKEKRSHRKTHGKISFGDLARTIANKWKKLDNSKKTVFEGSAIEEKERYRRELQEWNKKQKKWKEATAKMTQHHHHHRNHLYSPSIVTPTQHPRATLQSTDQHLMTTLMKQQKRLLEESGFVSGDSPSLTPNSDTQRQVYADELLYGRRSSSDFYGRPSPFGADRAPFMGDRAPFGGDRAPISEHGSSYSGSSESGRERSSSYNEFFGGGGGGARRSDPMARSPSSSMYDYGRLPEDTFQAAQSKLPNYQEFWLQQRRMQLMEEQQHRQQRYGAFDFDSPLDRPNPLDRPHPLDRPNHLDRPLDRSTERMPTPTDMQQGTLRDEQDSAGFMSPHPFQQDDYATSAYTRASKHYTAL